MRGRKGSQREEGGVGARGRGRGRSRVTGKITILNYCKWYSIMSSYQKNIKYKKNMKNKYNKNKKIKREGGSGYLRSTADRSHWTALTMTPPPCARRTISQHGIRLNNLKVCG